MLHSSWAAQIGDTFVVDCPPQVYRAILKYIYSGVTEINGEIVLDLMYLAKEYGLFSLMALCETYARASIDIENICDLLCAAEMCQTDNLKYTCLKFLEQNYSEVSKREEFERVEKLPEVYLISKKQKEKVHQ